jgi:hypothetical protein
LRWASGRRHPSGTTSRATPETGDRQAHGFPCYSSKLRFNLGYHYYGYKEDFGLLSVNENFRANTGYPGLLFSF